MKIIEKLALVLITLIICQYSLTATSSSHFTHNFIDTIPPIEPEYKGNRIVVKSIKVLKKKGKSYKIEYKLVNNGRNKIKLGKPSLIPKDLIIQFDKSLFENDLVDAKATIIERIKKQSISIRPGQLIMGNKIKFSHRPIPPSDRIAAELEKEGQIEKVIEEEIIKKETPLAEDFEEITIPKTKFDKAAKDIVEEIPLPNSELESPRVSTSSKQILKEDKTKKTPLGETILVKKTEPSEKLEIEETESILEILPSENPENFVEVIVENENTDTISTSEITEQKIINIIEKEISANENLKNQNSNEKLCPDLIIESVDILKKNKRFVVLNYTIKNVGNIPIALHGNSKKEMDNVAIQSHFTRSHNLTRGSIPVAISYIKKGKRDKKGILIPGESITLKLKVEISKITKFTPVLALTLNPSSANFECNKLNNIFFIDIAEKAPDAINSKPQKKHEEDSIEKITTAEN